MVIESFMAKRKIAVILYNLGGPDSLDSVKPFLFNLFNDKSIIDVYQPLRYFIAKCISTRRAPIAQEIYKEMGGKSPILDQTYAQANALEILLKQSDDVFKVFVAMRHWKPFFKEVAEEVGLYGPDEVLLLPLYPQFSTTTTGSAMEEWQKQSKQAGITALTKLLCCYYEQKHFIEAVVDLIQPMLDRYRVEYDEQVRVLFSAHGLPKKIVDKGDPYVMQVERTVAAVVEKLGDFDCRVCYQSRVGPLEWVGPSTGDEIKRAGEDKVAVLVVPIAFVSEHSETLVELDIEYKEYADECGVIGYGRIPTVGCHPRYIEGLKMMVDTLLASSSGVISENGKCCTGEYGCVNEGD